MLLLNVFCPFKRQKPPGGGLGRRDVVDDG
jgi:hypothetical protein